MESKPIIDSLLLMRKWDMRTGYLLGKSQFQEFNRELMQILDSLIARRDIPEHVRRSTRDALDRTMAKYGDSPEKELPELEDYLQRLRTLGITVDNAHAELTSINTLVFELNDIMRDVRRHRANDPGYVTLLHAVEYERQQLDQIQKKTADLWDEVSALVQSVHLKMKVMEPPTSQEVAEGFVQNLGV